MHGRHNGITIEAKALDRLFCQSTGGAEVTWPVPSQVVQLNAERVFETKNREQYVSFEVSNNSYETRNNSHLLSAPLLQSDLGTVPVSWLSFK
jgi:hypothetical protein